MIGRFERVAMLLTLWLSLAPGPATAEVWVRDFGAVPDDGQDDSAAFQAALRSPGQVRPWPYTPPGQGSWTFRDCRFGD